MIVQHEIKCCWFIFTNLLLIILIVQWNKIITHTHNTKLSNVSGVGMNLKVQYKDT
jgi:hypothetical protein